MAAEGESWYPAIRLQLINFKMPWKLTLLPKHDHQHVSSVMPKDHVPPHPHIPEEHVCPMKGQDLLLQQAPHTPANATVSGSFPQQSCHQRE